MASNSEKNETEDEPGSSDDGELPASVGLLPMSVEHPRDFSSSTEDNIWFVFRCSETASLVFLWMVVGYYSSIIGTTMIDFQERLHTSLENIGIVLTFRILGNMAGGVLAGIVRERLHVQSELILGISCLLSSLTNFFKPWSPSVVFLATVSVVEGFFSSCLSSVGNALLLDMWGDKASAPIHAFHFGYGFGSFCGPLISEGYLSIRCSGNNNTNPIIAAICNNLTESRTPTRGPLLARHSRIEIPYAVAGGLALGCACIFMTLYLLQRFYIRSAVPPSIRSTLGSSQLKESTGRKTPMHFLIKFIIFYMLLLSCLSGIESFLNNYLFALSFESDLGFTKSESAYLSSSYWAFYTGSRFVFSIVAHFVSVKILLFIEFFTTTAGIAGLAFLGLQSRTAFWIISCVLGVVCAPIYPSAMSFIDRYIPLTGTILGIVDIGGGSVGAFNMWLAARLVERGQGKSFLYLSLSFGCFSCILITVAQIYGSRHGDRHLTDNIKFSRLQDTEDDER